jgi:hypothetical protein
MAWKLERDAQASGRGRISGKNYCGAQAALEGCPKRMIMLVT